MRRRYTREEFVEITRRLRAARPDIDLTSDIIVAFPGESESQFRETLEVVAEVGFVDSYSFKFSPRPGTKAEQLGDPIPGDEAQRRLCRLQEIQRSLTLAHHRSRVGSVAEILVQGASRRGDGQVSGRDFHHRLVNVNLGSYKEPGEAPRPGSFVAVKIVEATPHSLIGELAAPRNSRSPLKGETRSADERPRNAVLVGPGGELPLVS
jgi:tRNA-2-methylthio-N6-dimethylallyladenosine synthase